MNFLKNPIFNGITEEDITNLRPRLHPDVTVRERPDRLLHRRSDNCVRHPPVRGTAYRKHRPVGEPHHPPQHFRRGSLRRDLRPQPHPDDGGRHRLQDSEILFLDLEKLLDDSNSSRPWHTKLLRNLLQLSAQKHRLVQPMLCISSRHIRTRIMTYLSAEAVRSGAGKSPSPSTANRWRTT